MMMMKVETHNFVKNVIVVMAGNSLVVLESRASQKPLLKLTGDIMSVCVRDDVKNDNDDFTSPRTSSLPLQPADHINAQHLICMTADELVVVLDPDLENNSMHIQESFSCQPTALTQLPAPEFAQTKIEPQFIHVNKGRRKSPQRIRAGTTIISMNTAAVPRTMVCRWDARLQLFVLGRSDGSVHLVNSQREVVTSFDGATDSNAITALCTAVSIKHQRTSKPGVMMPPMSFVVYATAEGTLSAHPIAVVLPKALRDPTTVPRSVSFVAHSSPVVSVMQMPLTPVGLGSGCIVTVEAAGAVKIWSPPPKLGARGLFTATGRGAFVGAKITAATLIEHPSNSSVSILIGFESGALWAWRVPASLELPKTAEANHPTAHRRRISALEWLNSSNPLVDSQGLAGSRLFVSASLDQSIKLWNADKFEQLRSFTTAEPVDTATFYFSPPLDGARALHILMTSEKSIFSVNTGYSEPLATRQATSLTRAHTTPRVSRSAKVIKTDKQQQQLQQLAASAPSTFSGSPRSAYSSDREMSMSAGYMNIGRSESTASLFTETWDRKASTLSPLQHPSSVPALQESTSNWAAKSGMFAGVSQPKRLGRLVPINNTAPANNLAGLQPADLASINNFHIRRPATTDPNRRLSTRNKKLIRVTFDEYGRKVKHEVDLTSIYENPKRKKNMDSDTLKKMYQHVPSKIDTNNKRNARKVPHAVKGVPFPYAFRSLWLVPDVDAIVTYSQPHSRGVKAFTKTVKKKGNFPTLGLSESPMTVSATVGQVWELYILRLQAQKQQAARRNLRGKLKGSTVSRVMKRRYIKHHEDTFANFVYQTFQRRAGVQILAQERLLRLLDSLLLHQAHPACQLCGRFLTLFGQMSHLKEETFRIFGSIMLPLFNENKLWSPPDHNTTTDLVTAQSKPAPELQVSLAARVFRID